MKLLKASIIILLLGGFTIFANAKNTFSVGGWNAEWSPAKHETLNKLSSISFAFATVTEKGQVLISAQLKDDLETKFSGTRFLSVGGAVVGAKSQAQAFIEATKTETARHNLSDALLQTAIHYRLTGLEVDWEDWYDTSPTNFPESRSQYLLFVATLAQSLFKYHLQLRIALTSPVSGCSPYSVDSEQLSLFRDVQIVANQSGSSPTFTLMHYNLQESGCKDSFAPINAITPSVRALQMVGIRNSQLILGLPLYAANDKYQENDDISTIIGKSTWQYDSEATTIAKVQLARRLGLQGVSFWRLDLENARILNSLKY